MLVVIEAPATLVTTASRQGGNASNRNRDSD
jgi:hypothetical protein